MEKISSLLYLGNVVLMILMLKWVSSFSNSSDALKGEASIRPEMALVVAIPGVDDSCDFDDVARLRRPPFVVRVGM